MITLGASPRLRCWLLAATLVLAIPHPLAAQLPCEGDCGVDGEVTVDEILRLVNIALGSGDVATCTAGDRNGDAQITVDEIVTAVQRALNGCPMGVTETWIESDFQVVQAGCPPEVVSLLEGALGREGDCAIDITIAGDQVTAVDCEDSVTEATIGEDGITRVSDAASAQIDDCLLAVVVNFSVDLRQSPTQVNYKTVVTFTGDCPLSRCEATFASTLTRQ